MQLAYRVEVRQRMGGAAAPVRRGVPHTGAQHNLRGHPIGNLGLDTAWAAHRVRLGLVRCRGGGARRDGGPRLPSIRSVAGFGLRVGGIVGVVDGGADGSEQVVGEGKSRSTREGRVALPSGQRDIAPSIGPPSPWRRVALRHPCPPLSPAAR